MKRPLTKLERRQRRTPTTMFDSYPIPRQRCPYCNKGNDQASHLDCARGPQPRDFSMCASCGGLCIYDNDMTLRQVTREELYNLPTEVLHEIYLAAQIIKSRQRDRIKKN